MERLRALARARAFPAALIALCVALQLPSLWMGFWADDYVHQLALSGELEGGTMGPWSLYDFGTAEDWRAIADGTGGLPWWTTEGWKVRFFRPLASLALRVDHALFGDWALGYHLSGLAWYALLLGLALAVYRALGLARPTALLALAVFGATNGAALTVGWPANRNSVVSTVFVLASVLVVARGRGRPAAVLGAVVLGALAMAGKESGVLACALVALWLVLDARRRGEGLGARTAALAALPLAIGVAWVAALASSGYGTNCSFYATPWHEPLRYAANAARLGALALLRLVLPISIDVSTFEPRFAAVAFALVVLVALPIAVWVGRRAWQAGAAPLLAAWLLLGIGLQGAAPPSDRLLLDPALGSAGLVALAVEESWRRGAALRERRARRVVLAFTLPISGLATFGQSAAQTQLCNDMRTLALATEAGSPAEGPRERVVLQASSGMLPFVLPATWAVATGDRGVYFAPLQLGRRGLELERTAERTFAVRSLDEPFATGIFESVYRVGSTAPAVGARFPGRLFDVLVTETEPTGARALELSFHRTLDDPALRLLIDGSGSLAVLETPAVGARVTVPTAAQALPFVP